MNRSLRTALAFTICSVIGTTFAYAQAPRTWVSGVGDDANPCSRTAPCKTFAGAISKTAIGGEISVLDPGGFGGVTINKSITLDGDGTLASIQVTGTSAININAANVVVTIRNLSLLGVNGLTGINLVNGAAVVIDHVSISGFTTGVLTTVGSAMVINSNLTQNTGFGVRALNGSIISVENSMFANNQVAVQSDAGGLVNLVNNGIYNNKTGFSCGGGSIASAGNNRKFNNTGGVVATCDPDAVIAFK
jgi:hypothetical protein